LKAKFLSLYPQFENFNSNYLFNEFCNVAKEGGFNVEEGLVKGVRPKNTK